MGTVYKKHGTWVVAYDLPRTPDGRRRRKVVSCPGMTKPQARAVLADIERDLRQGTYIEPTKKSLGDYLAEWLHSLADRRSPATVRSYESRMRNHILPTLGHMPLAALQPIHIEDLLNSLLDSGLSARTTREVFNVLHSALARAVRLRQLYVSPANFVDPPQAARSRVSATDAEGIKKIIDASAGTIWRIPVLLAALTGMRRAEICALRWEDYDPEFQTLIVRRSVVKGVDGELVIKGTKTDRDRIICLPGILNRELAEHRERQASSGRPSEWVCPAIGGGFCRPDSLTKAFRRIAKRAGVGISLHGARHSHATLLLEEGIPVMAVSERLGHATTSVTTNIYAHSLPHMQRDTLAVIDRVFDAPKETGSD